MSNCPMCNHPNEPMGALGQTEHYHCRACGWWYYERPWQDEREFEPTGNAQTREKRAEERRQAFIDRNI